MTDNVIQLDLFRPAANLSPSVQPQTYPDTVPEVGARSEPRHRSGAKDGRRKAEAKSRSVEPNITGLAGDNGGRSYRVQIRKTLKGVSRSFAKTFSTLAMARKWKKRKLAELELHGVKFVAKSGDTVAAAIDARLAAHVHWLRESEFGAQKLCDLSVQSLIELAAEMLGDERAPQTVTGYLTILVHTLDWASGRDFIIPVAA